MLAFHVEGTGIYDGEVNYSDTRHGNNTTDVLVEVREEYEAQHGKEAGLVIEFRAWPIEE